MSVVRGFFKKNLISFVFLSTLILLLIFVSILIHGSIVAKFVFYTALVLLSIFYSGHVLLLFAGKKDYLLAFVTGSAVLSHLVLALEALGLRSYLYEWPIVLAFAVVMAALHFSVDRKNKSDEQSFFSRDTYLQIITIGFVFTYSAIWSFDSAAKYTTFLSTGKFEFWSDLILHAMTIAEQSDLKSTVNGALAIIDTPRSFYHRASYVFPALYVSAFGTNPLETVFTIWIPLGIFIMFSGIAALGNVMIGRVPTIFALCLIVVLPDAGRYGLANGMFSMNWLLEASPGTPYGVGLACCALALLISWLESQRIGEIAVAFILVAATFFTRAHIFVWLLPAVCVVVVLGAQGFSRAAKQKVLLAGALLGVVALIVISRNLWGVGFVTNYFKWVHIGAVPTNYDGLYAWLSKNLGRIGALPFVVPLTLLAIAGPLLVWVGIGTWLVAKRNKMVLADAFPPVLVIVVIVLMMLAPAPYTYGEAEFRHRGFPFLVIVLAVWSVSLGWRLMPDWAREQALRPDLVTVCAGGALLLAFQVAGGWKAPTFAWGRHVYGLQMTPELTSVTQLIRNNTIDGQSFLVAQVGRETEFEADTASWIAAISAKPVYVSRPKVYTLIGSAQLKTIVAKRMEDVKALAAIAQADAAHERLTALGIGWYVVTDNGWPLWDPAGSLAVFRQNGWGAYRVSNGADKWR